MHRWELVTALALSSIPLGGCTRGAEISAPLGAPDAGTFGAPDAGSWMGRVVGRDEEVLAPLAPFEPLDVSCGQVAPHPIQLLDKRCPKDWAMRRDDVPEGILRCLPNPQTSPCPKDQVQLPADRSCQPLGQPCPEGQWPEDLGSLPVLYVLPGAAPGGDGSRELPFSSLEEALAAAQDSSLIALAKGTHRGGAVVGREIELRGACVAETRIVAPEVPGVPVLTADGAAYLSDLQLEGPGPGIHALTGSEVYLFGVGIDGADGAAIMLEEGAGFFGYRVAVRDTGPGGGAGKPGYGLVGANLAFVGIYESVFERNSGGGVRVEGCADVLVQDSVLRDNGDTGDGRSAGLLLADGVGSVDAVLIERNRGAGLIIEGGEISVGRSMIRGNLPGSGEGPGILVSDGANVEAFELMIPGNFGAGFAATGGAVASVTDVFISDTRAPEVPASGVVPAGLRVSGGARVNAGRVVLARNDGAGVDARGPGSRVELGHALVFQTRPSSGVAGLDGHGVVLVDGAGGSFVRITAEESSGAGLLVAGAATAALFQVNLLDNGLGGEEQCAGTGLRATDAEVDLRGVVIAAHRGDSVLLSGGSASLSGVTIAAEGGGGCEVPAGLRAEAGAIASLTDVAVCGPSIGSSPARGGSGILAVQDSELALSRLVIAGAGGTGLGLDRSTATFSDVVVDGAPLGGVGAGRGVELTAGASMAGERLVTLGWPEAGIVVSGGSRLQVVDVLVDRAGAQPGGTDVGIAALGGSRLVLERVAVARSRSAAVLVRDPGTSVELAELEVRGTSTGAAALPGGRGVEAQSGAEVRVSRGVFSREQDHAVAALDGAPGCISRTSRSWERAGPGSSQPREAPWWRPGSSSRTPRWRGSTLYRVRSTCPKGQCTAVRSARGSAKRRLIAAAC